MPVLWILQNVLGSRKLKLWKTLGGKNKSPAEFDSLCGSYSTETKKFHAL